MSVILGNETPDGHSDDGWALDATSDGLGGGPSIWCCRPCREYEHADPLDEDEDDEPESWIADWGSEFSGLADALFGSP